MFLYIPNIQTHSRNKCVLSTVILFSSINILIDYFPNMRFMELE